MAVAENGWSDTRLSVQGPSDAPRSRVSTMSVQTAFTSVEPVDQMLSQLSAIPSMPIIQDDIPEPVRVATTAHLPTLRKMSSFGFPELASILEEGQIPERGVILAVLRRASRQTYRKEDDAEIRYCKSIVLIKSTIWALLSIACLAVVLIYPSSFGGIHGGVLAALGLCFGISVLSIAELHVAKKMRIAQGLLPVHVVSAFLFAICLGTEFQTAFIYCSCVYCSCYGFHPAVMVITLVLVILAEVTFVVLQHTAPPPPLPLCYKAQLALNLCTRVLALLEFVITAIAFKQNYQRYRTTAADAMRSLHAHDRKLRNQAFVLEKIIDSLLPRAVADTLSKNISRSLDTNDELHMSKGRFGLLSNIGKFHEDCVICFADLHGFTTLMRLNDPVEMVGSLNTLFSTIDDFCIAHRIDKIKIIGDCYMAVVFPMKAAQDVDVTAEEVLTREDSFQLKNSSRSFSFKKDKPMPERFPLAVVDAATRVLDLCTYLHSTNWAIGDHALKFRAGMHVGPVVSGVLGTTRLAYDLWGDAVNLASRLESTGVVGMTQVSDCVHRILLHQFRFTERRHVDIKGVGILTTYLHDPLKSFDHSTSNENIPGSITLQTIKSPMTAIPNDPGFGQYLGD